MKKIAVASMSKNPVKMNAVLFGFQRMFPEDVFSVDVIAASSGVSDQPKSDEEASRGAFNRVDTASKIESSADYWVGLEGGVEDIPERMQSFAWIVIKSNDGKIGKAKTGTYFLPPQVAKLIREGKELGGQMILFSKDQIQRRQMVRLVY